MTDVLKSWAEKLNGIESFASLPQGTEKQLIQDNLTVLFIDKDDEYRFRGVYHYDGSMLDDDPFALSFYKSGTCLGDNRIDFIETDFCFDPQTQKNTAIICGQSRLRYPMLILTMENLNGKFSAKA